MSTAIRPTRTYGKRHSAKYTPSVKAASSSAYNGESSTTNSPSGRAPRMNKRKSTSDAEEDTESLSWLQKRRKSNGGSESREDTDSVSSSSGGRLTKIAKKNINQATESANTRGSPAPVRSAVDPASPAGENQSRLPTTPKRSKTLSSVFDAITPVSTFASPSRLNLGSPLTPGRAKKMLGRSRTEGTIQDSPSRKLDSPRKTKSFVETSMTDLIVTNMSAGSSSSLKRTESQRSEISSQSESQSEFRRPSTKAGRTYAGASRSFLVSIPTSAIGSSTGVDDLNGSQNGDDLGPYRASYTELRRRYGIDVSSDAPNAGDDERIDEGLSLYNPLSSITDLRSKGESRRFTDEVGYLLEGLDASAELGVRRSSASDIVQKLCDSSYWRKARAAGLLGRIWELMRSAGAGDGDKVLDFILCCYIALASEDSRDISNLASHDDFIGTVLKIFSVYGNVDPSPVKTKATKVEQITLDRMCECLAEKEGIVPDGCSPSALFLLSKALTVEPSLVFANINEVICSMSSFLAHISRHVHALSEGLLSTAQMFEKMAQQGVLGHLRNCFSILDAYLLRARSDVIDFESSKMNIHSRHPRLAADILDLVAIVQSAVLDNCSALVKAQFNDSVDLSFRILINLTDGSRMWSDAAISNPFALSAIIRASATSQAAIMAHSTKRIALDEEEEQTAKAMDRLCLALALLTNLLQELDTLAISMQDILYSAACARKADCLSCCQCSSAIPSTATIVSMYDLSLVKKDEEELTPDFLFLRGHLALLVALFLLQLKDPKVENNADETPFYDVLAALPGATYRRKFDALISNVDSFSQIYSSVASSVSKHVDSETVMDVEDDLLVGDHRSRRIANSNGTDKTQVDVVQEVLLSLRALRDHL